MFPILLDMSNRLAHGPAIRAIRKALGIKHGVFATRCQISSSYLTNIEKGVKQPSDAVIAAIASNLGVSVEAITYTLPAAEAA